MVAATTAPAFAASQCAQGTINWGTAGTNVNNRPIAATGQVAATTVTMTTSGSTLYRNPPPPGPSEPAQTSEDMRVFADSLGGTTSPYVMFRQYNSPAGTDQSYTLTFSRTVYNVVLTLLDIDDHLSTDMWRDSAYVSSGGPFTYAFASPTILTGTGSGPTDPWRVAGTTRRSVSDARGNVTVTFAGPLTSLTLSYRNLVTMARTDKQGIGLSGVTFYAAPGC